MNTIRTRIARLTLGSALVLGVVVLGAGPAWAPPCTTPTLICTTTADGDLSPDGIGKPGGIK